MAKHEPSHLEGKFIFIFWPDDDVWYRAKVLKHVNSKKFKIAYDDKTLEKIDLASQSFLLEDDRLKVMAA